jgi:hypothetical protein
VDADTNKSLPLSTMHVKFSLPRMLLTASQEEKLAESLEIISLARFLQLLLFFIIIIGMLVRE